MSRCIRIIPWLEIKGKNLIKGINMEGLRVLGAPEDFANYYGKNNADEIIYHDVVASLYGRNSLLETISRTAENIFLPLTVSGGIRSISDIKKILKAGADRVAINSAAIKNIDFVSKCVEIFGSSTICVNIQTLKDKSGKYYCYYNNGRELTNIDVFQWVKTIERKGAGEIILSSIEKDGTFEGFDDELVTKISKIVGIPLIVHGGCGKPEHIIEVYNNNKEKIAGFALSSILHYDFVKLGNKKISKKKKEEGNFEFISNRNSVYSYNYNTTISLFDLKKLLKQRGLPVRS